MAKLPHEFAYLGDAVDMCARLLTTEGVTRFVELASREQMRVLYDAAASLLERGDVPRLKQWLEAASPETKRAFDYHGTFCLTLVFDELAARSVEPFAEVVSIAEAQRSPHDWSDLPGELHRLIAPAEDWEHTIGEGSILDRLDTAPEATLGELEGLRDFLNRSDTAASLMAWMRKNDAVDARRGDVACMRNFLLVLEHLP